MKSFVMGAAFGLSLAAGSAHAQTAIQPGLWEVSDKTTMEGVQPMPSTSRQVCIKGGEATLERLLYPTPDDFAKHGCSFAPGPKQAGIFKATTVCPPPTRRRASPPRRRSAIRRQATRAWASSRSRARMARRPKAVPC